MIDQKLAIITIHDVNPSNSEEILKTSSELNNLKIKYNLSVVPYYRKKYNLKDYDDFCDQISSLLQSGNVELNLHGLYHQTDGKFDDFDTGSKEQEKEEIQKRIRYFIGCQATEAFDVYTTSMASEPSMYRSVKGIEL